MNFGDRIKQLRTQKNLTQPQLAQAIGIEQSYLSKLENDKSVPGADIFQSILRAFNMDVASFLEGVDDKLAGADRTFVEKAALGGMAEVELGNTAQQKAASDQVKQFAARMVTDQARPTTS